MGIKKTLASRHLAQRPKRPKRPKSEDRVLAGCPYLGNLILIYSHVSNKLVFAVVTSDDRERRLSLPVPNPRSQIPGSRSASFPKPRLALLCFWHLFFVMRNFRHSHQQPPDSKIIILAHI